MMDSELHQTQERWWVKVGLAVASGILLGFSFPPSPFYSLAYVAFIPMFFLFARLESFYQIAKYSYLFLLVFHLITVYWTGGFVVGKDIWMMTAGTAVVFIHPIFYLPGNLACICSQEKTWTCSRTNIICLVLDFV